MAKRPARRSTPTTAPAPVRTIAAEPPAGDDSAIVVGRSRQRRVDVPLVHGSILDVTTRAVVLGSFRSVDPGGAAKAVDARLGGSLRELIRTRTVSSEAGTMFVLPTTRTGLRTDMVIFAGLGPFDRFDPSLIQLVASNLVRTMVRGNVEEFATVLFGAGSGFETQACTQHLLRGILGGLRDSDNEGRFRGFTICELDKEKFGAIREEVFSGCRADFCKDFDVVVRERYIPLAPPAPAATGSRQGGAAPPADLEPVYLLVRTGTNGTKSLVLKAAVLTAGGKAAVLEGQQTIARKELDAALGAIEGDGFGTAGLTKLGQTLATLVLPEDVRSQLDKARSRHVAVVHDLEAARLPWEALRIGDWVPALNGGMSRRYVAADLAVGRWAEHRGRQQELALLLIVDPTGDLAGAVTEAERIGQLAAVDPRVRITRLTQKEATRAAVLEQLQSERYDAIHYAGHAFFDPKIPGESGIRCADGTLRALDLLNLRSLPPLLFFNACEAGRLRRARGGRRTPSRQDAAKSLGKAVGFAEAFMRYGVANFVGTYWPVGDAAASLFAKSFYGALLAGGTIGDALLDGRKVVQDSGSIDWADYIHYGDPRFRLKVSHTPNREPEP